MKFKIRASAASQLMGVKGLGLTGKHYAENWLTEQLYSRRKEFDNKYVRKGNLMEDASIDYIAEVLGLEGLVKNEESFENEYCTGTPDVFVGDDAIIDVKNSYDCFTFPLFANTDDPMYKPEYYGQAQVYMYLTGRRKYEYIFTLMNTPDEIVKQEFKYKNTNLLSYEDFAKDYQYDEFPVELRMKRFNVPYDQGYIDTLIERVEECRKYLQKIYPDYDNQ